MHINLLEDAGINVVGNVEVNRINEDGSAENIFCDKNIVVNSGILLLLSYLTIDSSDKELSGITHLAVGNGTPDIIANGNTDNASLVGISDLKHEVGRVVRWDTDFLIMNGAGGFDVSDDPTNIVRYKYRLRKNEPAELTYISEIGMYGGDVLVEQTPFVTIDGVAKKGTLFSYKYFNPPIDKYVGGILEFVWTINFLRG